MAAMTDKGSLAGTLIRFSIPLVLSGVLQQMYAWADAFIVGNLVGEGALAAIGATTALSNLFVLVITGLTLGVSILAARLYGQQDWEGLKGLLPTFAAALGLLFCVVGVLGSLTAGPILTLMHTPEDIADMSRQYLQIILLGLPFVAVYNVYAAVLRGMGESKAPLYAVLVASLVNVGMDLLLVGVFPMGVQGAAAATLGAQVMMAVFMAGYAVRKRQWLSLRQSGSCMDKKILWEGLKLGLPVAIQSSISSLGSLALQNFMNEFGSSTLVAAITTAYRVDTVLMLPVINLSAGISTITAQSAGAGDEERARRTLAVGTGIMSVTALALTALIMAIGGNLIAMFGVTAQATAIGREFFRTIAWFYLIYGLAMAMRGYLEGMGDVLFSSVMGIAALGLRIVLSYGLADAVGNMIIAYAEAASWCAMLLFFFLRCLWMARRPPQEAERPS